MSSPPTLLGGRPLTFRKPPRSLVFFTLFSPLSLLSPLSPLPSFWVSVSVIEMRWEGGDLPPPPHRLFPGSVLVGLCGHCVVVVFAFGFVRFVFFAFVFFIIVCGRCFFYLFFGFVCLVCSSLFFVSSFWAPLCASIGVRRRFFLTF